ncbi:MAG: protein translocase subunit SecDF [Bacteroidota bacterium]
MQNKGVIRVVAILFAIASLYQLSFTYVTSKVRKDAQEYANGDLAREMYYLDSLAGEVVYNIGVARYTFRECQEREINLGLDLKGGMNVILEVSVVDILRAMSNYSNDTTFNQAIRLARQKQQNSQEDFVTLFGQAFQEIDPNGRLAAIFATPELREEISFNSTNEEVLEIINREAEAAIDNSFNILRSRIDRFGVAQPNIQLLETAGRILVELPGVKDQDRVRNLLQGTANLEFWETFDNSEIYPYLIEANTVISELEDARGTDQRPPAEAEDEAAEDPVEDGDQEPVETQTDTAGLSLLDQIATDTAAVDTATQDMSADYPLFSVLRPNVVGNNQMGNGSVIGYAHYKDTSKVNEYLNWEQVRALFPRNIRFMWSAKPLKGDESMSYFELHAIKVTTREGIAPLDGDVITDARVGLSQFGNEIEVHMSMNAEGAKTWARLTREAANQSPKGFIAISLDNQVRSSARVNDEITGGSSTITGGFTQEEATDLSNVLKSGKMPAPAHIIQEAIVGPSLGQEAINSGLNSFVIAFLVVLLYMVFYYSRRAGFVADVALIANMYLLIGVLASLGAVLTLPGIAGIVLTIGMSVDANVLIYERIREEIRAGKGIKLAIADGYKNAYSAIIDANVTTLLTAIILFVFGTGPIKGFATTLLIGIGTSLFSAIFITRLIFENFLTKGSEITFATKLTEGAFKNTNIQFINKRKVFYVVSGVVIAIGIVSLVFRGLNYGVDFTGGRTYVVRFDEPVNTVDIQNMLADEFGQAPEVKTFGADNQVKIVTKYKIDEDAAEVDREVETLLFNGLQPLLEEGTSREEFLNENRQSSQKVGPTIADDIKKQAVWAILFSLIVIFMYILLRFKNWQYGMGAVAALIHDSLFVLGIFSLFYNILPFSMEIDQAFIAAILTVVGYSINDTVVVFDRIREFIGLHPKHKREDIMNSALNSTLSRTFSTSLSTFVVLLTIFIFGGEVIRGFIFALLVGIVVGTYSSLFIATPVVYDTIKKQEGQVLKKGKKR